MAQLQAEELARITGTATADQTSNIENSRQSDYVSQIRNHVRKEIRFLSETLNNNPEVVFKIIQLPNGRITSYEMISSSGNKDWDYAVELAISRTGQLPQPPAGQFEKMLILKLRPKEAFN